VGKRAGKRAARGDYQTPEQLATRVCARVAEEDRARPAPRTIIEPTCGRGNFLAAAIDRHPQATAIGYEIDEGHVAEATAAVGELATIRRADFFELDWFEESRGWEPPILVVGNPPWVTTADLTDLGSANAPHRSNFKGLSGIDARTGKGNFDISEWMVLEILRALQGRDARVAMLIKTAVARRVFEHVVSASWAVDDMAIFPIDARREFDVSVDACLFVAHTGANAREDDLRGCRVHANLSDGGDQASTLLGIRDGVIVADLSEWERISPWIGDAKNAWRSGVKHDCAGVMELERVDGVLRNAAGDSVQLEPHCLYPLVKSSDLAHGRTGDAHRWLIIPQRRVGAPTEPLARLAPATWMYLCGYGARLDARKSSIYSGQPRFSIFGIGEYAFAPWKVCISGLHKRFRFRLVGPVEGRPVMLDDTCYFMGFEREAEAREALGLLSSEPAGAILRATVFKENKRPITKQVLARLELARLREAIAAHDPEAAAEAGATHRE
jgi:hypothetical protein